MTKTAIVINKEGYKQKYVVARQKGDGYEILSYTLRDGESLVFNDIVTALKMVKPRRVGTSWHETATDEEISVAKAAKAEAKATFSKKGVNKIKHLENMVNSVVNSMTAAARSRYQEEMAKLDDQT